MYSTRMYYMESIGIFFHKMNAQMSVRMKKNLSVDGFFSYSNICMKYSSFMLVEFREEKVLFLRGN